jgi:four helix bundle protein
MQNEVEEGKHLYGGLNDRFKSFALEVWAFCDAIPDSPTGKNVRFQLTKSASSVAANFRAALRARSDKEYIAKLGVVEEESDETCFWLDMIKSYQPWESLHTKADTLFKEAHQLTAIIVSLIVKKKRTMP